MLGGARLEIFANYNTAYKKVALQRQTVEFVRRFVNYKNYKDVLLAVKNDIPKLLGYQTANIMLLDDTSQSLYAMTILENDATELE